MKLKEEIGEILNRKHEKSLELRKKRDEFLEFLLTLLDDVEGNELQPRVWTYQAISDDFEVFVLYFETKINLLLRVKENVWEEINFRIIKYMPFFLKLLRPHENRSMIENTIVSTFEEVFRERAEGMSYLNEEVKHVHVYLFKSLEIGLVFFDCLHCEGFQKTIHLQTFEDIKKRND
nr:MAG: hypothetical protein [Lokiarchaeota virus Skoll Meg22_1214]